MRRAAPAPVAPAAGFGFMVSSSSGQTGKTAIVTERPRLRHVVFFSARDKADIPRIVAGLETLARIPHAQAFEVRLNSRTDIWSDEIDVVVYAEFASPEALAAYRADPIYEAAIAAVRPLRDLRIAADF